MRLARVWPASVCSARDLSLSTLSGATLLLNEYFLMLVWLYSKIFKLSKEFRVLSKLDIVKNKSRTVDIVSVVNDFVYLKLDCHAPFLILKKAIKFKANAVSEHNHIPLGCATILLHVIAPVQQLQIAGLQMKRPCTDLPYSRWGLTKALYNFRKDSLSRNVNVCLMIPAIWLAFLITFLIYYISSKFRHSSKVIPRSFSCLHL